MNKKILDGFKRNEQKALEKISEIYGNIKTKEIVSLIELWKAIDYLDFENKSYYEFKENFFEFWINEKYNKGIDQPFNYIFFNYGGLNSHTWIEAYSGNIETSDVMGELNGFIDTFPSFDLLPVKIINDHLQENYDFWDNNWDALMDFYDLFELSSYRIAHNVIKIAFKENLFKRLNLIKPSYFTINEHDNGRKETLLYVND